MAKQNKLNRVPPFIPLLWQDWRSSPLIRSMTMAQRGIFIEILIEQWIYGNFPRSAWELSRRIGSDFKTTGRLLKKYSELAVCCQCGASWTPLVCQCDARNLAATCHNPKLQNLRNDVDSDLALGTTELNLTKPQLKLTSPSAPFGGAEGEEHSFDMVYKDLDHAKRSMAEAAVEEKSTPTPTAAPSPLVDDLVQKLGMAKPPDPALYAQWARRLTKLVDTWGAAKHAQAIAYVFENPMYSRGIKTSKEDKVNWLSTKYESILAKMDADAEYASKKSPNGQDNRPQYLKNPSGGVKFGKSVV